MTIGCLGSSAVSAQDHVWSQLIGGAGNTQGFAVTTDRSGDVIVAGSFDGEMTIANDTLSTGKFTTDGFVAKFSADGTPLWAAQFGDEGTDIARSVAVNDAGTVFVAGYAGGDAFLAAYDGDKGSQLWANTLGGEQADTAYSVVVNERGDVLLIAGLQGTGSFGGAPMTSAGSYDLVIASYKPQNGAHQWSQKFGTEAGEVATGATIIGDTLVVVGNVSQKTDLGTGSLPFEGRSDGFIAAYSALDGAPLWSKTIGGSGFDSTEGVATDPEGNIVVVGYFGLPSGDVDFGGGNVKNRGGADVFVAKYSSSGAYIWASGYGGIGDDYGRGVAVDRAGTISIIGQFQQIADLGGDPITSLGQFDVLMGQYTSSGQHLWSKAYGNVVSDKGFGVTVDPEDHIIATGFTLWRINFGGGNLTSKGYADAFLAKLAAAEAPLPTPTPIPTPDPDPIGIAGQVLYFSSNQAVPGVGVLMQNSTASEWTQTGAKGDYAVMGVHEGTWDVEPAKDGEINGALSSLDAAYALQASVGLRELNEAETLACDVTGNGRVSALDAAEILRRVVGTSTAFPAAEACGSDWLFIPNPEAAANQTVTNPGMQGSECVQGQISLDPLIVAVEGQDFQAVLLGDCTGNWRPSIGAAFARTAASTPVATVRQLRRTRRGTARVPIRIHSENPVHAIDVLLRYDPSVVELTGATVRNAQQDTVVSHSADDDGQAMLAVASAQPLGTGRGTMLIIEFDVVGSTAPRNAVEVIQVTLDEKPADLEQRPASLIRRRR